MLKLEEHVNVHINRIELYMPVYGTTLHQNGLKCVYVVHTHSFSLCCTFPLPRIPVSITLLRLDLELLLHLVVEAGDRSRLITGVDVLPGNSILAAAQDVLVDARQAVAESQRAPLAVAHHLELHAAADGLSHAKRAAQRLHPYSLLRGLPVLQARFERVCRHGLVRASFEGGLADTVAQRVVDAGRRRGGCGLVARVGEGVCVGRLGDDAHGLQQNGLAMWLGVEGELRQSFTIVCDESALREQRM